MILSDVLNRIKFKIGSYDDIQSLALNPLVSTSNILYELNAQMLRYAMKTRGIRNFYSVPVSTNTQFLNGPTYCIRTEGFNYAWLVSRGWANPLDIRGYRDIVPAFHGLTIRSPGAWIMPIHEDNQLRIFFYPMPGISAQTTTLTSGISAIDTTIPVVTTGSLINTGGRVTIDSEVIMYQYKDATNLYGCVRGEELTTAAIHNNGATVTENNLVIHYCRKPVPLTITDSPSNTDLATPIPIVDDHIEGVTDLVAYNLLIKIDPSRSTVYKVDGDAMLEQYRLDIGKGYNKMRSGTNTRQPYINESGLPLNANIY